MGRDYTSRGQRPVQSAPTVITNPQSSTTNQWFGRTTISSQTGGLTFIPAGVVQAQSHIGLTLQCIGAPGSENVPQFVVKSITVGSGFTVGPVASFAVANSYTLHWRVDCRS